MSLSETSTTAFLIRNAQNGDASAREELFRRHVPRVTRIVALRMRSRFDDLADVEDVVQETLLDACTNLQGFEPRSDGAFRNWLATLAQHNVTDRARRRATLKRGAGIELAAADLTSSILHDGAVADRGASPSEIARANELEQRLERALLELDERHRRVIDLRRLCDMSFGEIAEEMGLSKESSARSLFSRAMSALSCKL